MIKKALRPVVGSAALTRALGLWGGPRLVVLCYHDLRRDDDFASWLRVARSEFACQLRALAAVGDFVGPEAIIEPHVMRPGRLHFLVTFDDGYHNNYEIGAEILDAQRVPAVFFVSTAHVRSGQPFWFDQIVTPIQRLQLTELDLQEFGLGRYVFATGHQDGRWSQINQLLEDIKARGNQDSPANRLLQAFFRDRFGHRVAESLSEYAPLTPGELRSLAALPRMEIGSHGHEHDIVTHLDDETLRSSLRLSREVIRSATGADPRFFAFPNGDHDARTRAAAADVGFELAFAANWGYVKAGTGDPFAVPRLFVSGYESVADIRLNINRILAGV